MLGKALGCVSGWPGRVATSSTTLASPGLAAFVRFGRQRCAVCDPSACVRACVRVCVCVWRGAALAEQLRASGDFDTTVRGQFATAAW